MAGLTKPTNSRFWRLITPDTLVTKGNSQETNGCSQIVEGLTKLTKTSLESSFLMAGLTKPTDSRFWRLIQTVSKPKETKGDPQEANGCSNILAGLTKHTKT